jgi:hypothetical protein
MRKFRRYYKICSCGAKISSKSRNTIKRHREKGHKVPLRHVVEEVE